MRTEHCDGRCGETTLDLGHVRSEEDVLLPLADRGKYGIPKGVGLGVLCVWGTKRSAYLPT